MKAVVRYKAVLLDFYGTLVEEDDPVIAQIAGEVAAHLALNAGAAQVSQRWWELMAALCRAAHGPNFRLQRDIEVDSLRQLAREFHAGVDADALAAAIFRYWRAPRAYPGATDFLRALRARGLPICVVSNIDDDDLRSAIGSRGWDLPMVVTSEMCRAYKPRPEMFAAALDRLGAQPRDVLHVGDSLCSDVAGAQRFGVDVAWLNRRNRPMLATPPTVVAASFDNLLQWLDGSAVDADADRA